MRTRANGLTQVGPEGQAWPTRKSRSSKILVAIQSVAVVRCSAVECETRTLSQKLLFFVIKYETKKIGVARKICGLEKKITRSKICFSYEEVSSNLGRKFDQQRVSRNPWNRFRTFEIKTWRLHSRQEPRLRNTWNQYKKAQQKRKRKKKRYFWISDFLVLSQIITGS